MNVAMDWNRPRQGAETDHDILKIFKKLRERSFQGVALISRGELDTLEANFVSLSGESVEYRAQSRTELEPPSAIVELIGNVALVGGVGYRLARGPRTVLQLLIKRADELVHTSAFIEHLYGDDPDGGPLCADRSVRRFIKDLRQKIPPLRDRIETVYGEGYKLRTVDVPGEKWAYRPNNGNHGVQTNDQ